MKKTSKEYKGEKIVETFVARLVPPNSNYEDAVCVLLLTERHLYVVEECYGRPDEVHFNFPLSQIKSIELVKAEENSYVPSKQNISPGTYLLTTAIGMISGFALGMGDFGKSVRETFLMILYHDGMGKVERLYFGEFQCASKKFLRAYEGIKGGKVIPL